MVQAPPKAEQADSPPAIVAGGAPIVLRFPAGAISDELLIELSELNEPWHFERNLEGALEISPPPGTNSGRRSARIAAQILQWSDRLENGESFGPGSGFSLSIGSARDPDAAWVSNERLEAVDTDDEGLWFLCPDLVVEVRSRGQRLSRQREKMEEWMAAGARLGWLIDPFTGEGEVWVYRAGGSEAECLERPGSLSGEDVAEGLRVDLGKVWR